MLIIYAQLEWSNKQAVHDLKYMNINKLKGIQFQCLIISGTLIILLLGWPMSNVKSANVQCLQYQMNIN